MTRNGRYVLMAAAGLIVTGWLWTTSAPEVEGRVPQQQEQEREQQQEEQEGQTRADEIMSQWRRQNPSRAEDWVAEEKERHTVVPPADNSDILTGGEQERGQTYAQYTERDIVLWEREIEKLVVDGSRIFHDAELLGSTVAVSCDMCHPHAANTHPETYPKFQVQMGRVALLRDMINWCIEQPVRGTKLEPDDPKMRALEAYIYAQRKGTALNYGKH